MKLFQLNLSRMKIIFQLETGELKKKRLEIISQAKKSYAFAIFSRFVVSLGVCALLHCITSIFPVIILRHGIL